MSEIIGAGLCRTGTSSTLVALERLELGPVYHMKEVMARNLADKVGFSLRYYHSNHPIGGEIRWKPLNSGWITLVAMRSLSWDILMRLDINHRWIFQLFASSKNWWWDIQMPKYFLHSETLLKVKTHVYADKNYAKLVLIKPLIKRGWNHFDRQYGKW